MTQNLEISKRLLCAISLLVFFDLIQPVSGKNLSIANFNAAKKHARKIHLEHPFTVYCGCKYSGNKVDLSSCGYRPKKNNTRASRLEWEHIVPAEAFGNAFVEWRQGAAHCTKRGKKFKGRKCAETNPEFAQMEGDLYNLWPAIGELNGLRSNYSMAEIGGPPGPFGKCAVRLKDRKFEPMPMAKGIVARTYLYMEKEYPGRGIISRKNEKLFAAWDKLYPVTPWECKRAKSIEKIQKSINTVLKSRCLNLDSKR